MDFKAFTDTEEFNDCKKCTTQYSGDNNIGNILCSEHFNSYYNRLNEEITNPVRNDVEENR